MRHAVEETIAALELRTEDEAAIRLARDYADQIDGSRDDPKLRAWSMRWIAPQLLDVLDALGATPAARARLKKGEPLATTGRLSALRAARS